MTPAAHYTRRGTRLTRKEVLKLGLLGGAALLLPLERAARTKSLADRIPTSRLPRPFTSPFAVPPVLKPQTVGNTDYYRMTMTNAPVRVLPGFPKTEIWGYNGITPGPTIIQERGRETVVRQINAIRSPDHLHTSVHLHGNATKPQYDGYANDVTKPGWGKDYRYPNGQPARTLWYHDHGVHVTSENAYRGLAGLYITHDEHERGLGLPKGYHDPVARTGYDVPLVIRDAVFATNGSLIFDREEQGSLFGDVILVNGVPWPVMKVERRKYRFRVLNASISRSYKLALSSGDPMTVIGSDGGLMPHPVRTGSVRVGMAERYEIVIDFARYKVGTSIVLRNGDLPNNREEKNTNVVMRFDVVSDATDTSGNRVPWNLGKVGDGDYDPMPLLPSQSTHTERFVFERKNGNWVINDGTWKDIEDSGNQLNAAVCKKDEIEIWEFQNKSGGWFHPIHVHLIDFKILSRTGGKSPGVLPYERGPKDTAYVGENETVRVLAKFGPHQGRYMMHCHNLTHEDHDMMTQFQVGTGGERWDSAPPRPASELPPLLPGL
ncbi:multicopper oxidase domain-containing protein [Rubrobacter tropicus]|uniref:Multicopper oxidase domain-containing protein n=1 Tax=Rubrobacter tropicus TaxID=2653851 RepID=A0A6G8Q4J4_9ACTN|nr:multicopper oxidase family protein [Rubrobacter tropicus]QIN81370.1 multicopper oxidase domain-containing protein [Rubrobacter tropicus]